MSDNFFTFISENENKTVIVRCIKYRMGKNETKWGHPLILAYLIITVKKYDEQGVQQFLYKVKDNIYTVV